MDISIEKQTDAVLTVHLYGRLDAAGADAIGLKLTAEAATHKAGVVIDMAGVNFLASIGIRLLLTVVRAQKLRGGKVVLLSPQPLVREVLHATGCDALVAIHDDAAAARADVEAALAPAAP